VFFRGLYVACGGSGHGFKFAPVLGEIVADVFEKKENEYTQSFKWRIPRERKSKSNSRL